LLLAGEQNPILANTAITSFQAWNPQDCKRYCPMISKAATEILSACDANFAHAKYMAAFDWNRPLVGRNPLLPYRVCACGS
jgi:hypothetical protein